MREEGEPERRTPSESGGRREDDRRLAAIEAQLKGLTTEIGRIRTTLGLDLKTLMFDLDTRYMPREELKVVYVPRREHEQQQEAHKQAARTWKQNGPMIALAFAGWATNLILILSHSH